MLDQAGLVIRVMAAVVWTLLAVRAHRLHRKHGHYLRRLVMLDTVAIVLWGLVLRGLTILHVLSDAATGPLITASLFVAFIAGVALLTTQPDP